jgi:hypothetical protein
MGANGYLHVQPWIARDWREYDREFVNTHIYTLAGMLSLAMQKWQQRKLEAFEAAQSEIVSILHTELQGDEDRFLEKLKKEIEEPAPCQQPTLHSIYLQKGRS